MIQPHATDQAPAAIGPYAQAVSVGGFLYTSGQIALDPASGQLVAGGFEAEARQVLANLRAVLASAGCTFADVVKTTCFLIDINDFAAFNAVYARFMPDPPPARSTFAVAALPKAASVEIEAVAVRNRA